MGNKRLKILVLSRAYPNNLLPTLGLWVRHLVHHCKDICELKVISPVPYYPPMGGFAKYRRFRKVARYACDDGVQAFYPRFIVGPGRSLYITEAFSYLLGILRTADRLHRAFRFDIVHAHFTYPDGVVASWLGRRYKIPVIITEHAPWRPNWMDKQFLVRWQAVDAARRSAFLIAVSNSVKDTIVSFTGQANKIRIIPIGFDKNIFFASQSREISKNNQILFVGFINFNKGIDVLLKAFNSILERKPNVKLVMVGGGLYNNTMKQERQLRDKAEKLKLVDHIEFAGIKKPVEVAKYMRESSLLVLPSRAESFGAVLVEAIACGTPVVSTKCGGPEDIVGDGVGILVAKENDKALAMAIENILDNRENYKAEHLRDYACNKFSWDGIAQKTVDLYSEALNCFGKDKSAMN